jgi:hypothetical protein
LFAEIRRRLHVSSLKAGAGPPERDFILEASAVLVQPVERTESDLCASHVSAEGRPGSISRSP